MTGQTNDNGRIVVGVDGSDCARAALRWAMIQARVTGATVEAVHAWQTPTSYGSSYSFSAPPFAGDTFAATAAKSLDNTIAAVSAELDHPVAVLARIIQGPTVDVLRAAAVGAQLLVVGGRAHNSSFSGMLLDSVSQHCVQHSPCSVVIAR